MVYVGQVDGRGDFAPLLGTADARYLFLGNEGRPVLLPHQCRGAPGPRYRHRPCPAGSGGLGRGRSRTHGSHRACISLRRPSRDRVGPRLSRSCRDPWDGWPERPGCGAPRSRHGVRRGRRPAHGSPPRGLRVFLPTEGHPCLRPQDRRAPRRCNAVGGLRSVALRDRTTLHLGSRRVANSGHCSPQSRRRAARRTGPLALWLRWLQRQHDPAVRPGDPLLARARRLLRDRQPPGRR